MIDQIRTGDSAGKLGAHVNRQTGSSAFGKAEVIATRHQLAGRPRMLLGGAGGLQLQSPLELDYRVAVPANTLVNITPANPLATSGLVDLVAGVTKIAPAGWWISKKTVPAAVSGAYNVPQLPYPGATGAVSGTPSQGDADGDNVFWLFLGSYPNCLS